MSRRTGSRVIVLAVLLASFAVACGSDEPDVVATATALAVAAAEARADSPPVPTPASTAEPSPVPDVPTEEPTPSDGYNSDSVMYQMVPGAVDNQGNLPAPLAAILDHRDLSQVPVLVEAMRFFGGTGRDSIVEVLEELTGQELGIDWNGWVEWLGKNSSEFRPPEDYPDWKLGLLSLIHPRFANFLHTSKDTSRIDLTEVVWGGVPPDGIPDLKNPENVLAKFAGFMNPGDRVFGVSINGEKRAYPLRIINAHEMANDVLGGEPISVMW